MATTISGGFVYGTEYTENFNCKDDTWKPMEVAPYIYTANIQPVAKAEALPYYRNPIPPPYGNLARDPMAFQSTHYPNVFRETVLHKDDRGKYIDPFQNHASCRYGRRLLYDQSHPNQIYASQWSSELADVPSIYSFPTTTGLQPEIPFAKDLQWQAEGEVGHWPTEMWKEWCNTACCPPYEGYTSQVEYSRYKVNPFAISSCPHPLP